MKYYDVTVLVSEEMAIWPGNPEVSLEKVKSLKKGDSSNLTHLKMGVHSGTHIDAPNHFEPEGIGTDQLPVDVLMGRCRVLDLTDVKESIDRSKLSRLNLNGVTRLLFKTTNSRWWDQNDRQFHSDFIHLAEDGAHFLVDHGIRLVGIDYLSIEKYKSPDHATHHVLLRSNVIVIEGLNLSGVSQGDYELAALPVKLEGADGAPTRVILREI